MTPEQTAHYHLLRLIEHQPEISQRDLAQAMGVSLGKTHYLLKALLEKGLVKANNFRRSDNKLAYAYLLTPSGIAARLELTRAFLRLKEQEYEAARREIARLRQELDTVPVQAKWMVFQKRDDLHKALSDRICELAGAAISTRGRFTLVVLGGQDAAPLYARLRDLDTVWDGWQILLGDDARDRQVFDTWLSQVPVPREQIAAVSAAAERGAADLILLSLAGRSAGSEWTALPSLESLARGSEVALLAIGSEGGEPLSLLAGNVPHPAARLAALADLRIWADTAAVER